jgi:hypothetical protein
MKRSIKLALNQKPTSKCVLEHLPLTGQPSAFAYRTTGREFSHPDIGTGLATGQTQRTTLISNQSTGGNMKNNTLNTDHVTELLYQALETEKGGVQIYTTALRCALNEDLKEEWNKYLEQTKTHVQIVSDILKGMGLDTDVETPGRKIVRHIGDSLVQAMEMALRGPDLAAAQIVAAECVTLAETKDHLNWGLIGEVAKNSSGDAAPVLKQAHDQVEPEEDEHLYHTGGYAGSVAAA